MVRVKPGQVQNSRPLLAPSFLTLCTRMEVRLRVRCRLRVRVRLTARIRARLSRRNHDDCESLRTAPDQTLPQIMTQIHTLREDQCLVSHRVLRSPSAGFLRLGHAGLAWGRPRLRCRLELGLLDRTT